ncbi:putative peptidase family M3 [Rosellinia necatrix]|uniref:Putative peptidase family M3 n=1 Tax=Rosellinia necatrix TaxID=77044 RepID=A0A1S7UKU6_ROSNE|nr:putative peptidase family M3 [Rosellinia necatrix]
MFEQAIKELAGILSRNGWVAELAGILPLSALIEFIDLPPKFHVHQLAGFTALWNSPITPAGSRLLLSRDQPPPQHCYLDHFGKSIGLLGLDGRYGDRYYLSSPETIRMCLRAHRAHNVQNLHENMKGDDIRLQRLEVVHVSRLSHLERREISSAWPRRIFPRSARMGWADACGWIVLLGMIVMSGILQTWLSLAFLVLMPITGIVVFALHGRNPRRLLVEKPTPWNRLVLVAEHENTTDWVAFYGESTIINSLLNRPLKPLSSQDRPALAAGLRMTLRVLILGQWAIALGAAAVKDWSSYFITFWIAFCIFMQAYGMPPDQGAKKWMKSYAGIKIERYCTTVSSRRGLLNTIVALNPDTIALSQGKAQEDRTQFAPGAIKWMDPILAAGPSRAKWETATLEAMNHIAEYSPPEKNKALGVVTPNAEWKEKYKHEFWAPFILEGIYLAAKIKEEAKLPGRRNDDPSSEV